MADSRLLTVLAGVRRRLLGVSLGRGLAWGLSAAVLLLVACAWTDLALDLLPTVRLTCVLAAGTLGLALLAWAGVSAVRQGQGVALARRLDRAGNTGGQILAGVDLARQYDGAAAATPNISTALARMAVERAARLAADVQAAAAVPLKPLYWPAVLVLLVGVGIGIFSAASPRLAHTQWLRFTDPFGDHPPYSAIEFAVTPGDTKVLYGSALDVRVTPSGGVVEQVDLVLLPPGTSRTDDPAGQVLPMFPEPGGSWRATVAEVTTPGRYVVRSRGARSRQFRYDLITVPEIRDVRFRVTPPAYTGKPPYEGKMPDGGISGLPNTKVEAWLKSNRPLSGGPARFVPAAGASTQPAAAEDLTPVAVAFSPVAPNAVEARAEMLITRPGRLELGVTDVDGQTSRETVTAPIHLLRDDRPFVRVMEPRPQSFATPDVTLNVAVQAEDDYGVSRVQVFRSLNDSRPRPIDVPVPAGRPRRVNASVPLKLSDYGLKPGDVIRIFARVEDTDPDGAKGSESSIVTVQVLSKEELNRMTMARQGLETLQSKYDQVRRRMEALDEQLRKSQEELSKLPPDSELSKERQQKLDEMAEEVKNAADDIARIGGEDLPLDIDRKLRQGIFDMAADVRSAGQKYYHAVGQLGLTAGAGKKATDDLRKELGLEREQFKENVTDPLEHLAKIYPLKQDEARFTDLAQRQRDLADRMQALEGSAGDDPKLKARLRDLEAEQRALKDELRELLNDIDDHVTALPADPKLDPLRKKAKDFADAVRASDAAQQLNASETALSEFKGGDAAKQAKAGAETLETFVARCKGEMGEEAGKCLGFQPKLSEDLGNTVQQLLEMEGLGMRPGMGSGSGNGYSARRNTLKNVGLYGSLPRMSKDSKQQGGRGDPAGGAVSNGAVPDAGDPGANEDRGTGKAAGASDANVPARYKRKVGDYFQRVADELGE